MSSYHSVICWVNFGLVLAYGLGLLIIPDWFLGKYIYKDGLWNAFTGHGDRNSECILRHLLYGLGLTWISWAVLAYAFMAFCTDDDMKQAFAIANAVIWACWAILDNTARCAWGLYAPIANVANFALSTGMVVAWAVAVNN